MEIFVANTEIHVGDEFSKIIDKIKAKKAFIVV